MLIAKSKCWVAEDGKTLVADGDEKAASLFSAAGAPVDRSRLVGLKNADDFVVDPDAEPVKKTDHHKK